MKLYILCFCVLMAMSTLNAQVPVMNPISGPAAVCSSPSQPATFSASASNSPTQFYWSVVPATGVILSSVNGPTINASFPKSAGVYTIYCYASNNNGSGSPVAKVILVYETPSVSFSGATSFCQGSSTFLMASATMNSGSPTLSFFWQPATGLSNQASPTVYASPTTNITYTVVVSTSQCQNQLAIPVMVKPVPDFTISVARNPICVGESNAISLTGTSLSYSVNGTAITGSGFTVSPSTITPYSVLAMHQNGCIKTQSFIQNVDLCVAIQKLNMATENFRVYPNPSTGEVTLRSEKACEASVIDQLGRQVKKIRLEGGVEETLDGLHNGIYFIVTSSATIKLIVAK